MAAWARKASTWRAYHSNMVEPIRSKPRRWPASALSVVLAVLLTIMPVSSTAQFENLPKLGAASGDELSAAAERRLGETIMRQIRRDPAYLDDAELVDYLNQLAQPLLAAPAAGGMSFELFAIDDPSINAFALPGGFIGVHVGLLIAAETESEIASVLAHEIGHVTQRHIARMLAQQKQASVVSMAAMALALLAARSNPQAAMGGMMLGDQVARQNMLAFSRDAEREADRVGFDILRQSDFDLQGMVSFFNRLQQSSRFYESNAPAYLRTHPVTGERIADLQGRLQNARYRQRTDSLDFQLLRARYRVTADESTDGRRVGRGMAEQMVRASAKAGPAPWYGLASIAAVQRDWARFDTAITQARARNGADHPYFDRLAASAKLAQGDAAGAVELARKGLDRFPDARGLWRVYGEALIADGKSADAVRALRDEIAIWRSDARLWDLLAQAEGKLNHRADAHRAAAERYVLLGSPLMAVEQLRLAQRAGDTDFYTASVIDARLRELEPEARREIEDSRQANR